MPWGHNVRLMDLVKDREERLWYVQQTIQNGWSRNVLVLQIESDLYRRQGKAVTNFQATLPKSQSDLAQQIIKDPYNFDFLTLDRRRHAERDLERGLLEHLRHFLIELGTGFAFVGSQVPLEVGGEDFKLDLLFYHLKLRCFIVIDLKTTPFKPEYVGKMNFYLSAVDDLIRHRTISRASGWFCARPRIGSSRSMPSGTPPPQSASRNSATSKSFPNSSKAHYPQSRKSRPS